MTASRNTIPVILDRHAEDAAFLWLLRDAAVGEPHYSLKDLAQLDNRVEAHLDGLRIAGDAGWDVCAAALEADEPGEVFAAAVLAFYSGDGQRIDAVINAGCTSRENFRALVAATGWLEYPTIEPIINHLLSANAVLYRRIGIAAHAIHRHDPGEALTVAVTDPDPQLRARALRAAGELRRYDLLGALRENFQSDDEACRFWSAWSAVLLGEHGAVRPLMAFVNFATRYREPALRLVLRVQNGPEAQNWLKGLLQDKAQQRYVLMGCGITGDPVYIPTLIKQMAVPELARVAGEAFSLITGVDLAYQDLEGEWPEGFEAGPTENPEDEDVDLDPDEDLPWPEQALVQQWWSDNKGRFQSGQRYLLGEPVSIVQCNTVLQTGFQRQRIAAALELALLQPDQPLFETRAPGFRQQRLLPGVA
jgi:uncharacterized protein (TIGR02270 family)